LFKALPALTFAVGGLLSGVVFASQSRAGVIAWCVLVLTSVTFRVRDRLKKPSPRTLAVIAIALVIASVVVATVAFAAYLAADPSRSTSIQHRWLLWQNLITLISDAPFTGVGFGQLNFAWTLTPMSSRAPDVFDHAHNFLLQWAVEFGLPCAILLAVLLAAALIKAFKQRTELWRAPAFAMITVALIQSTVEFPLWFLHLLLPMAAVLALTTSASAAHRASPHHEQTRDQFRTVRSGFAGLLMLLSIALAVWYWRGATRLTEIYHHTKDPVQATTVAAAASTHPLLGHYGDYAQIMLAGDEATLPMFARTTRVLIDERLLIAWARAYHRAGDSARANYLLARTHEFPSLTHATLEFRPKLDTRPLNVASHPLTAKDFR